MERQPSDHRPASCRPVPLPRDSLMSDDTPHPAAEMNHRIANNLALLAAMIEIDSRAVVDPQAIGVLEAARRRIHAIAGVHRRLYRTDSTEHVDLADFLEELAVELRGVCESAGNDRRLTLETQSVMMVVDHAVAVGLLVAELVSNACKRAYPNCAPGEVRILQSASRGGAWTLIVEDDGYGFDRSNERVDVGLGSRLIATTVRRLGATSRWEDSAPGTRFIIAGQARASGLGVSPSQSGSGSLE